MGADRPCAARVEGREACRRVAWRESPYCWYHLPRSAGDHPIDSLRWCTWRGDQCQRWALQHSTLCFAHGREGSSVWRVASSGRGASKLKAQLVVTNTTRRPN